MWWLIYVSLDYNIKWKNATEEGAHNSTPPILLLLSQWVNLATLVGSSKLKRCTCSSRTSKRRLKTLRPRTRRSLKTFISVTISRRNLKQCSWWLKKLLLSTTRTCRIKLNFQLKIKAITLTTASVSSKCQSPLFARHLISKNMASRIKAQSTVRQKYSWKKQIVPK